MRRLRPGSSSIIPGGASLSINVKQLDHHADRSARARVFLRYIWRSWVVFCLHACFTLHFLCWAQVELKSLEDLGGVARRFFIAFMFCCGEGVLDLGFLLVAR